MGPRALAGKIRRGVREPQCCARLGCVHGEVIFSAIALCVVLYSLSSPLPTWWGGVVISTFQV